MARVRRIGTMGAGASALLLAGGAPASAQDRTTVAAGTAAGSVIAVEAPDKTPVVVGATAATVSPAQDVPAESGGAPLATGDPASTAQSTSTSVTDTPTTDSTAPLDTTQ